MGYSNAVGYIIIGGILLLFIAGGLAILDILIPEGVWCEGCEDYNNSHTDKTTIQPEPEDHKQDPVIEIEEPEIPEEPDEMPPEPEEPKEPEKPGRMECLEEMLTVKYDEVILEHGEWVRIGPQEKYEYYNIKQVIETAPDNSTRNSTHRWSYYIHEDFEHHPLGKIRIIEVIKDNATLVLDVGNPSVECVGAI